MIDRSCACADCKNDKASNITIEPVDTSPFHLKGSFEGPDGTPYEGGHYEVVSTEHSSLNPRRKLLRKVHPIRTS
jgi:hypothetical protein